MGPSPRIAIAIDDDTQRRRFVADVSSGARVLEVGGGDELLHLARRAAIDVVVAGVLNRADEFLAASLRELGRSVPEIVLVGVFEPMRPSIDEAADLAAEIPTIGFTRRPGPRFRHLIRTGASPSSGRTFTPMLVRCIGRLPLYGAAKTFALLQALHPSFAGGVPEQARVLGVSRRNLERWFQGPDICSAGCFQSVCAAGEAAYLRLITGAAERDIASVVEILTREGAANPTGVARAIRSALRIGLEDLRSGGVPALVDAVHTALSTSRDPTRVPAQWSPDTRYTAEAGVLTVPAEDGLTLMRPERSVERRLDPFGIDAWPLVRRGLPFAHLVVELASIRREPPHLIRTRLISWLGELLVLGLIRREPGRAEAGEA